MFKYEPTIFFSLLIIFIALGLFIINRYNIKNIEKFRLAVAYFGAFSVALITYNIFITVRANYQNEQNRLAYNTVENIQKNFLEPQKGLLTEYPEGYPLFASMNPDTDMAAHEPKNIDPIKRKQVEFYYAIRIFQSVEDFISTIKYENTEVACWMNTFLQWMQSPILQDHWTKVDFQYTEKTIQLMRIIINHANTLKELRKTKGVLVADDYNTLSKNIPLDLFN